MKKSLIIVLFLVLCSTAIAQTSKSYQFFDGTYKELRNAAKTANKPYFIYFYANWCMPCKKMNENSFRNQNLVQYASKKYMGYAVDGESLITEGRNLADYYDIYFFPMFVIFTPEGKVSEKIDGFISPEDMLAALKRNENKHGEPNTLTPMYDDPPQSGFIIPSGKGLYRFFYEKQESEGYGVQVGIFENYESVLKKVEELQENYHRNIILHVDVLENKTLYRVILGTFKTKRAALTYSELLQMKEGQTGVIVNLLEMK